MKILLPSFDCSSVHDWQETLYVATTEVAPPDAPRGLYLSTKAETRHLHPTTMGLILLSPYIGLPCIEPNNLPEWLLRIWTLEDTGHHTQFFPTPEGEVPLTLANPSILLKHLWLRFPNCTPLTPAAFDQFIRYARLKTCLAAFPEVPPCTPPSPSHFPPPTGSAS